MIGIVTVNWNGFAVTRSLVSQILASHDQDFRVVVVNNSPEESPRFQKEPTFQSPKVQVLHAHANRGYAGGLNLGLRALLPEPAIQHFLLMNNDVEVDPDFLGRMRASAADPRVIYSPLILLRDSGRIQNTGGRIHIWLGGTTNLNKNTPVERVLHAQPDFLSGCLLFLHRRAVETVGFFDEVYGSYYEDVDYCLRARAAGFRLEVLWSLPVRHYHSYATRGAKAHKARLISRNQIRFARKHLALLPRVVFISAAIGRGFFQNLTHERFPGYLRGIWEGLR